MTRHKAAIIIACILFFLPFFWLAPGEINVGGDSGRLYFYDPYTYLKNSLFYSFLGSGFGTETLGYPLIPYVSFLLLLKGIFLSPTILINIMNGMALSVGFLSVYAIVVELSGGFIVSSVLAGLVYMLSQILTYSGWETPIVTHSQIFVNPFIFFLMLKLLLTRNVLYLLMGLFTSLLFSFNFSFLGAPPFFSFYPLSFAFLFIYVRYVRGLRIPYKLLSVGVVLFALIHFYHLSWEVANLFVKASTVNKTVFSTSGSAARSSLDYFIAIASNTKVSINWLGIAQFQREPIYAVYIVFSLILVVGFLFNKKKTLLLTGIFFLITLFFTSANITQSGFFLYKQLFKIPGFSMFRNFHGQWLYVYTFFFALLFGQSLAYISTIRSKRTVLLIHGICMALIVYSGIPLLTGAASIPVHEDSKIRFAFRMDPLYEKVLEFMKTSPVGGKVATFPFTGPGYQVLQGVGGGAYSGLPTISYLTGKSDFAGIESVKPFDDTFIKLAQEQDSKTLGRLLSIMGIRYIFYNSDPFIYTTELKRALYNYSRIFNPKDQDAYRSFIEKLPVQGRIDVGDKYHIYTTETDTYLPHIFSATDTVYTNNAIAFSVTSDLGNALRVTPLPLGFAPAATSSMTLYAVAQDPFFDLADNSQFHRHEPFVNRRLDDRLYLFVTLREQYQRWRARKDPNGFMDTSLFLASKRILEIERYWESMGTLDAPWRPPRLWQITQWGNYNYWQASLDRYQKQMEDVIRWVEASALPETTKIAYKININEQLYQHQLKLVKIVTGLTRKSDEIDGIATSVQAMFERLFGLVNVPIIDVSKRRYVLPAHEYRRGDYDAYIAKKDIAGSSGENYIDVQGNVYYPSLNAPQSSSSGEFIRLGRSSFDDTSPIPVTLNISQNLIKEQRWESSGFVSNEDVVTTLTTNNRIGDYTKGLMIGIPQWKPRKTYLISFDYRTDGANFLLSFFDKRKTENTMRPFEYKQFFAKILNARDWQTHQSVVSGEDSAVEAFLSVNAFSPRDSSDIEIRNLVVSEYRFPHIIFQKTQQTALSGRIPRITFTKINPTKYRIAVSGAYDAYTLVFLESFNPGWKLIDPTREEFGIWDYLHRILGRLGSGFTQVFTKQSVSSNADIIASYFDGDVSEGAFTNIFLEPATFETWGKSAVADDAHSQAFEYANAWVVRPEDMNGRPEYKLILEKKSQQIFYPSLAISIVAVIGLFVYSMSYAFLRYKKTR